MVASDPQDAAASQPWLWSDLLMGLLNGTSCQVQKVPTCYGENVDVVGEKSSRPQSGSVFAHTSLESSEAIPAATDPSGTAPAEPSVDKEELHSDDTTPSGSTDTTPSGSPNESCETSAANPPDISQIKVFAFAPDSLGSCEGNDMARQCCQKFCNTPCIGVDAADMAQAIQPGQHVEGRRALSGARFCVLIQDGSGILESQEGTAGDAMPAFREAFAEAVAEAAGVSISRVRVLDVGPPLEVWARSARLTSESELASASPSASASGSSSENTDTGAGVLRFLMADDHPSSSSTAGVPRERDRDQDEDLAAAATPQDAADGPGNQELGTLLQNGCVRVLAVIREQADLDELSGSTASGSACIEEPGALRAVELVMRQVEDPRSQLQQALTSWAGGEPVVACVTEDRSGRTKLHSRKAGGRRPRRAISDRLK